MSIDLLCADIDGLVVLLVVEAHADGRSLSVHDEVRGAQVQLVRGAFLLQALLQRRQHRLHVADAVAGQQHGCGRARVHVVGDGLEHRTVVCGHAVRPFGLVDVDVVLVVHVVGLALFLEHGQELLPHLLGVALDAGVFLHF